MKTAPVTIAMLDHDSVISCVVQRALQAKGYLVEEATDSLQLRSLIREGKAQLVLLDCVIPNDDGLSILRSIRSESAIPVIILSSQASAADKVKGLDAGADDYLAKPFDIEELMARIRAQLRWGGIAARTSVLPSPNAVIFENIEMDLLEKKLCGTDAIVSLTAREQTFLLALLYQAGMVLSREQLFRQVNGRQWSPSDRSLDVHLTNLRRKIKQAGAERNLIETVRSQGFRIHASPQWH